MGNTCSGSTKSPRLPFDQSYELMNQIGEGSTAIVVKARRKTLENDIPVAVKIMDKTKFSPEELDELIKEAEYLRELKHKSIIKIHDFYNDDPQKSFMVVEMVTGGDVFERLEEKTVYDEPAARSLMRNLLDALKHMHGKGIAHRDLKLAALMLREKGSDSEVVLMDFGLAARTGGTRKRPLTDECGTPGYAAPEVLKGGPYGVECDIWSAGVIAFTLLGGYPPFHSDDEDEVFAKTTRGEYTFDPDFWSPITPEATEFIKSMLVSQDKRPSASQCLKATWLSPKYDQAVAEADVKRQKAIAAANKRKSKAAVAGGKPKLSSKGPTHRTSSKQSKSGRVTSGRASASPSKGPTKVNNALFSQDSRASRASSPAPSTRSQGR